MFKVTLNDLNSAICKLLCFRTGRATSDASDMVLLPLIGQKMIDHTTA